MTIFDPELNPGAQAPGQPDAKEQRVAVPTLMDLLLDMKRECMQDLNSCKVGIIQSFNPTNQTAQIQIALKQYIENAPDVTKQIIDYPILLDCPVCFLGGGVGNLTFPVAAGDECLVIFSDRDIDLWYTTGQVGIPNSNRLHDLSDGFAIVGFRSALQALAGFSMLGTQLRHGDAKLFLQDGTKAKMEQGDAIVDLEDGTSATMNQGDAIVNLVGGTKAEIKRTDLSRVSCETQLLLEKSLGTATSGSLIVGYLYKIDNYQSGDNFMNVGAASNANGVQFIATGTTPTTWTHGSGLAASVTLRQAADSLCAALTAWVDTGGQTPNPATLVLINFAKTLFDLLLKS